MPGCYDNYLGHLCLMSFQRMEYGGVIGHGGYTQQQIIDNYLQTIEAMNPKPGWCVYTDTPFNDLNSAAGNLTFAQTKTNFLTIMKRLDAAGIKPILGSVPSQNYGTQYAAMAQWNRWVRRYASRNGHPFIDMNAAVYDINGAIWSGYSQDAVHFKANGHRLVAQRAIKDGLLQNFPTVGSVRTSRMLGDTENLLGDIGLFNADTNADGVADGWTVQQGSAAKCSVITPTPNSGEPGNQDDLAGKWQQLSGVSGDTGLWLLKLLTTGFSVGDVLQISARVQTENIEATGSFWTVGFGQLFSGGYTYPSPGVGTAPSGEVPGGCNAWASDVEDGLVKVEVPILAGANSRYAQMKLSVVAAGATAKLRVGEFTVINLTTGAYLS
jgi:hypothetical protein